MDVDRIRKDFPLLVEGYKGQRIIYFDSSCMTLRPRQVIDKLLEYYTEYPGCGGRSLHRISVRVTDEFERARDIVSDFINAPSRDCVMLTKNTTEAINLVAGAFPFDKGDIVLGTDHEHNSNLVPWVHLMEKGVIKYRPVPSRPGNEFDIETYKEMVKGARLVSMVHVSNLDGTRIPEKEVIDIAHDRGALVMMDCAQSVPHIPMDMKRLGLDLLAFSGHKACGPAGTGILAGTPEAISMLGTFIVGGDTVAETDYDKVKFLPPPKKFEGGLQDFPGFIGLGEALNYLKGIGLDEIHQHEIDLNRYATNLLKDKVEIMGPLDPTKRSGIFPFHVKGMNSHDVALMLDEISGIAIRSGLHCVHSWFRSKKVESSSRASFYMYNTKEEIDVLKQTLETIIKDFAP